MVRPATIKDIPAIALMVSAFAKESSLEYHRTHVPNLLQAQRTLGEILKTGIILVSEDSDTLTGMFIAGIESDLLFPEYKTLREIAWWVKPEYRRGKTGWQLYTAYKAQGLRLKEKGIISAVSLTLLSNSPDIALDRRGWRRIETNYILEEEI